MLRQGYAKATVLTIASGFDGFGMKNSQVNQTPPGYTFGKIVAPELADLTSTPDHLDARKKSEPIAQAIFALRPRTLCRSDYKDRRESSQDRLRRRLVEVCDAWDDFQECRRRDAVYRYLKAAFALVVDYKGRRRTKRLLRRAFEFSGLPVDNSADPFTAVIRCTSERDLDCKAISKWARALRYAAYCKVPKKRLKTFMKRMGGVNSCADRWAQCFGRAADENG